MGFYNYCQYAGITLPTVSGAEYTDGDAVSDIAQEAAAALYGVGVFNSLDPQGIVNRGQVATVFMRFILTVEGLEEIEYLTTRGHMKNSFYMSPCQCGGYCFG